MLADADLTDIHLRAMQDTEKLTSTENPRVGSSITQRIPALRPSGSLRLFKYVPYAFVCPWPPLSY